MGKMTNSEFAKYLIEHNYLCVAISCKDCPLEFVKGCNYDLESWVQDLFNGKKISSREEMFDSLMNSDWNNAEKIEEMDKAFKHLVEPIYNETKKFYDDYVKAMIRNNMTISPPLIRHQVCKSIMQYIIGQMEKEDETNDPANPQS